MSLIARCVAFGFIVCLQAMISACSARTPVAVPPASTGRTPDTESAPVLDTPSRAAMHDECALVAPSTEPIATIGLTDRIDPSNAPRPTNASERLLFGQLYETLVRVDCMGRVRPGLAMSWRLDPRNGQLWIVTLREDARFSDGTPVTAADVRAGWTRDIIGGGDFRRYVSGLVERVEVVDDRTLILQLLNRQVDVPATLAHPDLAVVKRVAGSRLPLGTRSSRVEAGGDAALGRAASELLVSRDRLPPLRFLVAPGDPRDLLDAGVDLLLTRDPATLDYAATLPHFQRVPLPWQRTHLFLTAGRSPLSPALSDEARQAVANDAVRGEARGAQGPFWFEMVQCHSANRPRAGQRPHVPTPRIVYDADDRVARDLAERFVALAGASGPAAATFLDALLPDRPGRTFQRAAGLRGEDLANALRAGTDAGYIVSVSSRPLDPCNDQSVLLDSVPWLGLWTIVPIVDTRLQAVVRRGKSGATTDIDGAVVIGVNDPPSR